MHNGNGTAAGVSLRDAARHLGVSIRTIRRHVARLALPKTHAPADAPGQWARVLLSADSLDAIASAVSKGTEPRPIPGVHGDTVQDSPGQRGDDHGQTWTSPGQDSGQPGPSHPAPDTAPGLPDAALDRLGDVIRRAVAQGVQDGLRAAREAGEGIGVGKGDRRASRARRWAVGVVYVLLGVTLAVSLGAALLLAARISALGAG